MITVYILFGVTIYPEWTTTKTAILEPAVYKTAIECQNALDKLNGTHTSFQHSYTCRAYEVKVK